MEAVGGLALGGLRVLVFMYRDGSLRVTFVVTDLVVDGVTASGVIEVTRASGTVVESLVIVNTVVSSTRSSMVVLISSSSRLTAVLLFSANFTSFCEPGVRIVPVLFKDKVSIISAW